MSRSNKRKNSSGGRAALTGASLFLTRSRLLFATLAVLVGVFVWYGGLVGIANSMSRVALSTNELEKAEWWLALSGKLSSKNAERDFLRAQLARKRGNLESMGKYLKSAFDEGFDPNRLDQEQSIALASSGQLTTEIEQKLKDWLIEPGADVKGILEAYSNGLAAISRFDEAIGLLALWEKNDPNDPAPNYRKGLIDEHMSQFEHAEGEYRKAIAKDPKFVRAKYNLAKLLLFQRRPQDALEFFRSCESGDSALAAQAGIAQCHKTLGDIEQSQVCLKKVLDAGQEAIDRSYRAVGEQPERLVVVSELGCIETELGNFAEAKQLLETALKFNPLDSITRYSYAVALRGLGMRDEAEANFEKTRVSRSALDQVTLLKEKINLNPHDTESRLKIGKIIVEHESERTGLYWIRSIFSYDPTNSEAHRAMAEHFESQGALKEKYKQLIEYHRKFVKK